MAFAMVCVSFIACGDDSDVGSGGTPLTSVTDAEYERLCERVPDSTDLASWLECLEASECQGCVNELLGIPNVDDCLFEIGTKAHYERTSCSWTVERLHACFDAREALLERVSCDQPLPEGEGSRCLSEFWRTCVSPPQDPEPRPPTSATGCDDSCENADDGECDDGGEDSINDGCGLGTDCADCGPRK